MAARTAQLSLANEGDAAVAAALEYLTFRRTLRQARWFPVGGHEVQSVLSFSSPSGAELGRLQDALLAADAAFDPARDLERERARLIEMMWRRYYGSAPETPRAYILPMRSLTETAYRPWFTHRMVTALRQWAAVIEAARRPWPEKAKETQALFARYRAAADSSSRFAPHALMQPLNFLSFLAGLNETQLITDRTALVAVAVERFRRAHSGALPRTLDELTPAYLPAVPEDPLSGRALSSRQGKDAYTIYSVGMDGKDDGGDLASEFHETIKRMGQRVLRGKDVGVRIPIH